MFSKIINPRKFAEHEFITIERLVGLIKNNPNKDKIEELRKLDYKSKQYIKIKDTLPCIFPHVTTDGLKTIDVINKNKYLYFDIDGLDEEEVKETIDRLWNNYHIALICKSVGGRGISFFIKVEGLTIENFKQTHNSIKHNLRIDGFDIDNAAGGLVRKWYFSSDEEVKFSSDAVHKIKEEGVLRLDDPLIDNSIHLNDPLSYLLDDPLIEYETLLSTLNFRKKYEKKIEGDFVIDLVDNYYKLFIPRVIVDGTKHQVYTRMINAIMYLNPFISLIEVTSYIHYTNVNAEKMWKTRYLRTFVFNLYNIIKRNGITLKLTSKLIHFNPDSNLTEVEKKSIGRKVAGNIQVNKSIKIIRDTIKELEDEEIKVTKKVISERTGLSISTIKRRWKSEERNLYEIKETKKRKIKKEKNDYGFDFIDQISFEDFFNMN